eukprot:CAMPEP_0202977642 /NCGR_PEP_ID=MMETSP1396-20130829/84371_1 /ASSEMBLY_ACC=CAM_ASM_000872 /TAXON_ID= /ORGANISM="Pseudokeronopsis sp., Strain Brazil" /LENGTH=42 /DNA_ID= /DNA_START= /DNA_END= /DNA_ORIENTATION=
MWKLDLKMQEEESKTTSKNALVLLGGIMNLKVPNIMVEGNQN